MAKGKGGFLGRQRKHASSHAKANGPKPKVPVTGGAGAVKKP